MHTEDEARQKWKQVCKIEGCTNQVGRKSARGMCRAHYNRWQRGKDLNPPVRQYGEGWTSSHGYHYIGKRAVHRMVMEKSFGRVLDYNEVVHHKDGDITNNAPENLEVMDRGDHVREHVGGMTNKERQLAKEQYGVCLRGKSGKP